MNYVIFKKDKMIVPVVSPDSFHSVKTNLFGFTPVAAGSCYLQSNGGILLQDSPNQFGLRTNIKDAELISAMLNGANENFYIDFNNEYPTV